MEFPKPGPKHDWLQRLVGDWTFEGECQMGPDQAPAKTSGVWRIRPLGGFWIVIDGEGTSPDGETHRMVLTIGFDTAKQRFAGSFIASMMSKLWIYDGEMEGADTLVLAATGPSFAGDGDALYHDVIERRGDDAFRFYSRLQGPDGGWTEFMTADYRRTG